MKKFYITDIDGLNEFLGLDANACFDGDEIDYGEKAVIFDDVTEECEGNDEDERLEDFLENADNGQAFVNKGKVLYKARNRTEIAKCFF